MSVLVYAPDLMDRSKIAAAAPAARFVSQPAALADATEDDLVVVDLTRPGVLAVLPRVQARTIGFANHTMRELRADAATAGCDQVLTRSELFADLARWLEPPAGPEGNRPGISTKKSR